MGEEMILAGMAGALAAAAAGVSFAFAGDSCRILFDDDQAWFQTEKDRSRPFLVNPAIGQERLVGLFRIDLPEDSPRRWT